MQCSGGHMDHLTLLQLSDCHRQFQGQDLQRDVAPGVEVWKHYVGEWVPEGVYDGVGVSIREGQLSLVQVQVHTDRPQLAPRCGDRRLARRGERRKFTAAEPQHPQPGRYVSLPLGFLRHHTQRPLPVASDVHVPAVSPCAVAPGAQDAAVLVHPLRLAVRQSHEGQFRSAAHAGQTLGQLELSVGGVGVEDHRGARHFLLHVAPHAVAHVPQVFGHVDQGSRRQLRVIRQGELDFPRQGIGSQQEGRVFIPHRFLHALDGFFHELYPQAPDVEAALHHVRLETQFLRQRRDPGYLLMQQKLPERPEPLLYLLRCVPSLSLHLLGRFYKVLLHLSEEFHFLPQGPQGLLELAPAQPGGLAHRRARVVTVLPRVPTHDADGVPVVQAVQLQPLGVQAADEPGPHLQEIGLAQVLQHQVARWFSGWRHRLTHGTFPDSFGPPPCLDTGATEAVATGQEDRVLKSIVADGTGELLLDGPHLCLLSFRFLSVPSVLSISWWPAYSSLLLAEVNTNSVVYFQLWGSRIHYQQPWLYSQIAFLKMLLVFYT